MLDVTRVLTTHYEACLDAHGATAQGMDWGADGRRLAARFETICRVIGLHEDGPRITLLDAGCGCGLLLAHLNEHHPGRVEYTGLDASEAMLAALRRTHPGVEAIHEDVTRAAPAAPTRRWDWVVANGLLTEGRGVPDAEMRAFAEAALRGMFARCRVGIVFNVMTTHVNYRDPSLFYWDPGDALAFAAASLSRHVSIHHDLPGYDYFCCVRRHPPHHHEEHETDG